MMVCDRVFGERLLSILRLGSISSHSVGTLSVRAAAGLSMHKRGELYT